MHKKKDMANHPVSTVKALARQAHDNPELLEQLFADLQSAPTRQAAVLAAWTLTHLPPSDNRRIAAHRETLARTALTTPDTSLRRLALALLERIEWDVPVDNPPEHYMLLLDFCFGRLSMPGEPYGVRSLCMKLAFRLAHPYPELLGELRQCLLLLEPADLGAGALHTRNKILAQLSAD